MSTVAGSYAQLGLTFSDAARASTYDLTDYGLAPEHVREAFSNFLGRYDASA